jgi:subtilisin family serine protease
MPNHSRHGKIVTKQVAGLRHMATEVGRREYFDRWERQRSTRRKLGGAAPPGQQFPMVPVERRTKNTPAGTTREILVVPDELVVKLPANSTAAEEILNAAGFGRANDAIGDIGCCKEHVRFIGPPDNVDQTLRDLAAISVDASRGTAVALADTVKGPDDPKPGDDLEAHSEVEPGGADVPVIVVIDTGLQPDTHRRGWLHVNDVTAMDEAIDHDPVNAINNATGATTPDGKIDPSAGHGTFVAGVIRRVAPSAKIVMIRAVDSEGFASDAMIAAAICRAEKYISEKANGRGVINLSLGGETEDDEIPPVIECALSRLPDEVAVVAAAGNEPTGLPIWPAASPRVISVAALDLNGDPADWSNFGEDMVKFSARGTGVISTFVEGIDDGGDKFTKDDYGVWTGTSFAAPQVAAAIALRMGTSTSVDDAVDALVAIGDKTTNHGHALKADDIVLKGGPL